MAIGVTSCLKFPHHKAEEARQIRPAEHAMGSHTIDWREPPPPECLGGAVAVGNFDGVHRGHASLLSALVALARPRSAPTVALTFDPHPLVLLRPDQVPPALTTPEDRDRFLHELGADQVVTLRTTREMLQLSAEQFFSEVICNRFAARAMVEGPNFGFGRGRAGTVDTLGKLCADAGIALTVVQPVLIGGSEVSSSRIRSALIAGDVSTAAELVGRPYRLHGTTTVGQRRGATLGFPTANLIDCPTLIPGNGVYAATALLDQKLWAAAVNIGPNPTFGENARKVEVHLIGFAGGPLYGHSLAVNFIRRLRDTRPFPSVSDLVNQLTEDIRQAREIAAPHILHI
jgi:riboflavin kinase/FMN adenylyltransferase